MDSEWSKLAMRLAEGVRRKVDEQETRIYAGIASREATNGGRNAQSNIIDQEINRGLDDITQSRLQTTEVFDELEAQYQVRTQSPRS